MKCFALTGGIASGKSTISALLKQAGIQVIDADLLARQVVEPGTIGILQIAKTFGTHFLDETGSLNRKKMAELIFKNHEAKQKLENIVHPLIANKLQLELQKYRDKNIPYVIYEAPLIFEKGIQNLFDATILVIVPQDIQEERLTKRDGLSLQEAKARMKTQMPNNQKQQQTEFVIDNSGSLLKTKKQLQDVWFKLTKGVLFHPIA